MHHRSHALRAVRERERYDEGLQRGGYARLFRHSAHLYRQRQLELVHRALAGCENSRVLELGSTCWRKWLARPGYKPKELHCINISQTELNTGIWLAQRTELQPTFSLMDAEDLQFDDDRFDIVIGDAILHHLDLPRGLAEVRRVLKPGGLVLFAEPLAMNPVAAAVRLLTPRARTEDEQPFRMRELGLIREAFDCTIHYEQLLSVPVGVLSGLICKEPDNVMTRAAFRLDRGLDEALPPLRRFYRQILIEGRTR